MALGMGSIALMLAGVGAGVQAYGQWRAGRHQAEAGTAAREAAESAAELSDYNAAVAEIQARDAVQRGSMDEARFRAGVRGIVGAQRAGFAAGNIDVGYGSALDVQADAAFLGELDALQIRTNASREAWGYRVQAEDYRRRGEITRREGRELERAGQVQRTQSRVGAVGTLLTTGSSLLLQRYGYARG